MIYHNCFLSEEWGDYWHYGFFIPDLIPLQQHLSNSIHPVTCMSFHTLWWLFSCFLLSLYQPFYSNMKPYFYCHRLLSISLCLSPLCVFLSIFFLSLYPTLVLTFSILQLLHQILSFLLNSLLKALHSNPKVFHVGQSKLPKHLPTFVITKGNTWGFQKMLKGHIESIYTSCANSHPPIRILNPIPQNTLEALTIVLGNWVKHSNLAPAREGITLVYQGFPDSLCPT